MPALVIAFFIHDISIILDFAGCVNIVDNAIFVPLISLAARHIIKEECEYDFKHDYPISILSIIVASMILIGSFIFIGINIFS